MAEEEAPPPPMMPPREESAFPSLPWAAGGVNELFDGVTPKTLFQAQVSVRDGLTSQGMGMMQGPAAFGQVGLQYASPLGNLKADLISQGVVNLSLDGFQPLPIMQLNTQLSFMSGMLVGGQLYSVLFTPVGVMTGGANLYGQLSGEFFTGIQPASYPGNQVMLGVHTWGMPGIFGGYKAAIEWSREVVVNDELQAQCAVTAAVTKPYLMNDGEPGTHSFTLSAYHRMSESSLLAVQVEGGAQGSVMSTGRSRQLSEAQRLMARWTTQGILGLALEQSGEKSVLSLCGEVDSTPGRPLNPKFGVTLQMSA